MIIRTDVERLRDPFVLVENGIYYLYGTGAPTFDWADTKWICYKNTSGKLDGEWIKTDHDIAIVPERAIKNKWAPEVHKYKGEFYMFTTYYSSETNHRGCTILKSKSPEGPFEEITNGQITPKEWDAIDGTLYVAPDGQPWMVFVHEWTSTEDGIGTMAIAKLSDDLTHFISEPVEIFRADSPSWTNSRVTDGCFMHTTKDGQLLMIWSNNDPDGYCVGIARSDNGKIDGNWIQDDKLLYSKSIGGIDGGHGMIFNDTDGKMYLSIHSPNRCTDKSGEKTIFIPLREENGTLICDI